MAPALVLWSGERHVQERPPFRTLRFTDQRHLRFLRESIAFARVTRNARANDIFPSRISTAVAWNDVVEIQIVSIESDAAVLARVLVALENIVAGMFTFYFPHSNVNGQHYHTLNPDVLCKSS